MIPFTGSCPCGASLDLEDAQQVQPDGRLVIECVVCGTAWAVVLRLLDDDGTVLASWSEGE